MYAALSSFEEQNNTNKYIIKTTGTALNGWPSDSQNLAKLSVIITWWWLKVLSPSQYMATAWGFQSKQ